MDGWCKAFPEALETDEGSVFEMARPQVDLFLFSSFQQTFLDHLNRLLCLSILLKSVYLCVKDLMDWTVFGVTFLAPRPDKRIDILEVRKSEGKSYGHYPCEGKDDE